MRRDDDELALALRQAEKRLQAKQDGLENALRSMDEAREEVKAALHEVHALREAMAMWLLSRSEAQRKPDPGEPKE